MEEHADLVLLVDDDKNFIASLHRTLRGQPYTVLEANSAEQALQILSTREVSVIITDQRMPGVKGLELLGMLRDRFPNTVRIMLTGYSSLYIAVDAINKGEVFRYLTKPAEPLSLMLAIREAIAHREMLCESQKLIELASMQNAYIEELEGEFPGITTVDFDEDGAIKLSEDDT